MKTKNSARSVVSTAGAKKNHSDAIRNQRNRQAGQPVKDGAK